MLQGISDDGFILKIVEYGEADKIVWIFSRSHGYIHLVAKGARRPSSKKSPHLDLINLIRFQTARGETPQLLIQTDSQKTYSHIKTNLYLSRMVIYLVEVLIHLLPQEQQDEALFISLRNYLDTISKQKDKEKALYLTDKFQVYLIKHLGYHLPNEISRHQLPNYIESIIGRQLNSQLPRLV